MHIRSAKRYRQKNNNGLYAIGSSVNLLKSDYYDNVSDLLFSEPVQRMKQYMQHGHTTCFQHCVNVSYYNYLLAKMCNLDIRSCVRAGLLHDLFLYDWHTKKVFSTTEKNHGWAHAHRALVNARKYFDLNPIEEDMIEKHMFPMNIALPTYRETVVIIIVDKICSLAEVISHWYSIMRTI